MDIKRSNNDQNRVRVMISFEERGKNGGPYISHKRISELLSDKYDFIPLIVPPGRLGIFNKRLLRNLREQIQEAKPDIVHIHGLQLIGYQLIRAAKKEKKPTVLAIRGFSEEAVNFAKWKKIIVRCCEIYTLKKADIVYCVSDYVAKQKFIIRNAKSLYGTIYNMGHIQEPVDEIKTREKLGFLDDDIVIISASRITEEKGFADLCDAILEWRPENNIKFLIVGEGDYLQTFKKRVLDNDLNGQVTFLGYREDVDVYLRQSDIFVLCSWHETLCNAILEAQKEGLPVVATNVGGIPEIIQNGKNGFLVEKKDVPQIIKKLKILSEDWQLRKKMGMCGKQIMKEKFSEQKIRKQLDEIYSSLLKRN